MTDQQLWLLVLGVGVLLLGAVWYAFAEYQKLKKYVVDHDWTWVGKNIQELPAWLNTESIPRLRLQPNLNIRYRRAFHGTHESLSLCGFEQIQTRPGVRGESEFEAFLLLHDPQLPHTLPNIMLARTNTLVNVATAITDSLNSNKRNSDYCLQETIPGFEAWRIHATSIGQDWLVSPTGQRLAQELTQQELPTQLGYGMYGSIVFVETQLFSTKRLDNSIQALFTFHRLLTQVMKSA